MSDLSIGSAPNVIQAVPFFVVADIHASLRFYVDILGFTITKSWAPQGKLSWCWIEIGTAALMLQEHGTSRQAASPANAGEGISVCFQCNDALAIYHQARERGVESRRPFVGNSMWVVAFTDPDGYKIDFESLTDVPEETEYTPSA
jgi:catechol 2,3-dioxygenase-like lactoylglutathione lyase family enzyme